jgi:hypothetical protein
MQLIYALPFILLSIILGLASLAIPRTRRYALQVAIAPVAFGFCSIVGVAGVLIFSATVGIDIFSKMPPGIEANVFFAVIYFVPGVAGTWLAVLIVSGFKSLIFSN